MKLKQLTSIRAFQDWRAVVDDNKSVGFVPTMGYLHEGHMSLVRKAKEENDKVIVSIFVNPIQFDSEKDLTNYPKNIAGDVKLLEKLGVDAVFTPDPNEIYPDNFRTYIEPTGIITTECEGASRPGHFRGVATVVLKLFNIVKPHNIYFGQKDAQQVLVISQMIKDFHLPVKLDVISTIREKDGLAISSRNVNLKANERKAAVILYKSLQIGQKEFDENPGKDAGQVVITVEENLKSEPLVVLDYFEIRHPETFEKLETLTAPALLLVAAKVGKTRLIDNFRLNADNTWNTGKLL